MPRSMQDTGWWMLKNNKQRGTGLRLVPTSSAFQAAFETTTRPGMEGITLYRWYLAQQYINQPLLINGRKFGIRLWVLVPGAVPLRVYVHRNGLALFSATQYEPAGETLQERKQHLQCNHSCTCCPHQRLQHQSITQEDRKGHRTTHERLTRFGAGGFSVGVCMFAL